MKSITAKNLWNRKAFKVLKSKKTAWLIEIQKCKRTMKSITAKNLWNRKAFKIFKDNGLIDWNLKQMQDSHDKREENNYGYKYYWWFIYKHRVYKRN